MESNARSTAPIVIVGAGPGIGAATARRFAREGHAVGLVARDATRLGSLAEELEAEGATVAWATADVLVDGALEAALARLATTLGAPSVVR